MHDTIPRQRTYVRPRSSQVSCYKSVSDQSPKGQSLCVACREDSADAQNYDSDKAGPEAMYGLRILNTTFYFLYKPENIAKLWRYKTSITTPGVTTLVLKIFFGMSTKAINMYTVDDSGISPVPKTESHVMPHNRIDFLTNANFHKHLLGEGLAPLFQNFSKLLTARFKSLDVGYEWTQCSDMMDFWQYPLAASLNEALGGPILHCVNPSFTHDLLRYYLFFRSMMIGLPRWWIPEAYRLRDSLIRDVKQWHAIARARFRESDIATDGTDPWWGSAFMRERQNILKNVERWGLDDIASSDMGIFWG